MIRLRPEQKGKCGELLVQYLLLEKGGVDSAPLTTDQGVDLVAYSSVENRKPVTIQVKASTQHGGTGGKYLTWQVKKDCPAEYIAVVDLTRRKLWLIKTEKFNSEAKLTSEGKYKLQWCIRGSKFRGLNKKEEDFGDYEMDTAIPKVFGI